VDDSEPRVGLLRKRQRVRQGCHRGVGEIHAAEDALVEYRSRRNDIRRKTWHGQYRARRLAQHLLGDRSEDQPIEARAAVRAHDEQVSVQRTGVREDVHVHIPGFAHDDLDAGACADLLLHELLRACNQARAIWGSRQRRNVRCGEQHVFMRRRRDVQHGHARVIQMRNRHRMIERVPREV